MDKTAAATAIAFLNRQFPARRKARLRFTRYHKTNRATAGVRTIHVPQFVRPWVLLHEFAHVLNHRVNGVKAEAHDESFYHNLLRVLDAFGESRTGYPWAGEYRQLHRWAKRDGYAA